MDFTNPARIEPFFDVEAETNVRVPGQTYRVTVAFAGTSEQLRPTLSSDPPLPTADVLALLFSDVRRGAAEGVAPELRALQNPNQAQTDILTARATQALTAPISAEVGKVVEQTFGVDTFQLSPSFVDPTSIQPSARLNPTARLTIGKRISDRVYLTFSRSLGTDRQRPDRAARDRRQRSRVVDSVAQRGLADLRARVPREARLLMAPRRCCRALARALLCAAAWLGAGGAADADVAAYLGKPVASVRLVIEGTETDEPLLRQIVATAPGQPLSMVQVRETVAHLFSLGRFEGVSVDATLEGGRVALRYELVPIHPVSRIRFTLPPGAHGIDEDALRRAVIDRYGASPPLSRVADMTRILADALRERGYLHPAITPRPEIEHDPGARDAGVRDRSGCANDDRHRGGGRRRRQSAPRSSRGSTCRRVRRTSARR